ncbi:hypothetical protein [Rhodopseudomonas palustris]|nr:hypothetical protein [Rhodopseudomonas palustris]QLH69225.1 hypothetical protein HZF03_20235 [Rhodopseudomonas palustris]
MTRLKGLENPTMDVYVDALVRVTIQDLQQQKQKLRCEHVDAVSMPR